MNPNITQIHNELANLNMQMQVLRRDLLNLTFNFRQHVVRMSMLENRLMRNTSQTNEAENNIKVNKEQQELLADCIEITGLPEGTGDDPAEIASILTNNLNMDIRAHDIISCTRMEHAIAGISEERAGHRPRLLVLRLANITLRDNILKRARHERDLEITHPDFEGLVGPFYINEHLTPANRILFAKTRDEARRNNWRYTWIRNGKIFARRDQGTPIVYIRSDVNLLEMQL